MFKKISAAPGILLVTVLLVSGCNTSGVAVTVKAGEVFTIGVGQTARIAGENMTITFNEVVGDSRAPENAQTVWEGIATSSITIELDGVKHPMQISQPGRTEQSRATFDRFSLTHSLNPYPVAGEEIPAKDYKLTMTVEKPESLSQGGLSGFRIISYAP